MNTLPACMYTYCICTWCPYKAPGCEEGTETGVIDGSLPRMFWEPNTSPLKEQQMLLTTEPSLQPQGLFFEIGVLLVQSNGFLNSTFCLGCQVL